MFVSYTGRQGSCILLYTTVMGKFAKSPKNLHMLHVYMSSDTHTCIYFIHQIAQQSKDRARPSEDNDDRVQIHSTAPKKEDKKDTRCYNFY